MTVAACFTQPYMLEHDSFAKELVCRTKWGTFAATTLNFFLFLSIPTPKSTILLN